MTVFGKVRNATLACIMHAVKLILTLLINFNRMLLPPNLFIDYSSLCSKEYENIADMANVMVASQY